MCAHSVTYHSSSPEETCQIAAQLTPHLGTGDVILLSGDVGAGKTHFARCLIHASLPMPEDVPSPTYTLVQTYAGTHFEIWHADLYRLTDSSEIEELGLFHAFTAAVCLIEWPDRLGELMPSNALSVSLVQGTSDDSRKLRFDWTADRWNKIFEEVSHV